MYLFAYVRASTKDQDASRGRAAIHGFVTEKGFRIAGWYQENVSGASLKRPELMRLLNEAEEGDAIVVEQIDRLSRLDEDSWQELKAMLSAKKLKVISLDLPTSHLAFDLLSDSKGDEYIFTRSMLLAINSMMMDMLAAIARKDYLDRARRQIEGIAKAKKQGKYQGRKADTEKHLRIYNLRVKSGWSISETAKTAGVSERTVIRVCKSFEGEGEK